MDNLQLAYEDISSSKPKKRKVDSFISDLKNNRDQIKEEKKKEQLKKKEKNKDGKFTELKKRDA